jgi:Zn-dependent alcohol dehydrogenase
LRPAISEADRYATFSTAALATAVAAMLAERKASLIAHHRQIATGASLSQALELAGEVKTLSAQYRAVLQKGAAHIIGAAFPGARLTIDRCRHSRMSGSSPQETLNAAICAFSAWYTQSTKLYRAEGDRLCAS